MSNNNNKRTNERRKSRHSERLEYKKDNELYEESRVDNNTVDGMSKINLSESVEKQNNSFFRSIYNAIFKRGGF